METISQAMNDQLRKAKLRLLLSHPFFASLLFKLDDRWDDAIPTACTNGVYLKINPTFFEGLTKEEKVGLLAHEVMHPAMLHHTRRGNRDPKIWNQACDYVINLILKACGITLPEGGLLDHKYTGMSSEQVYDLIKDNPPGGGEGFGEVEDFPGDGDAEKQEIEENKQANSVIQANELAKLAGKGSLAIDQMVNDLITPKIPWEDELIRFMTEKMKDDYTWTKPNRNYLHTGFYLPSLENETFGLIALFWDSSGSTEEFRDDFAGHINYIKQALNAPLLLVYADYDVTGTETFEPDEDIEIKPKGGGGTRFSPPFKWVEENGIEPRVAIYFTDGECYEFPPEPEYETIWAVCGNAFFNPPFGTVIRIK